jgi:hypothetical protein
MPLLAFYEKHYLRLLKGVAAAAACGALFFAGYVKGSPSSAMAVVESLSSYAAGVLKAAWEQTADSRPVHFLQPSRKPGEGVTVNDVPQRADLVLLTGFFDDDPGLRLIRRDGTVVASWPAAFSRLMPERLEKPGAPETDWNVDLHGSHVDPDGSVLFNFEYQGTVKLDRCGKRLWSLQEFNHHTLSAATGGGYWIGGRRIINRPDDPAFRPMTNPKRERGRIEDDEILRVSADGEVLARKSVFEIMMENGLEPLLTATGMMLGRDALDDNEILHLNKIDELTPAMAAAFPEFAAGDLVLSLRDYNLVMVVRPSDWSLRWHSTGPWLRQHSARFLPDGRIGVFNNNNYHFVLLANDKSDLSVPDISNVLAVDPATGQSEILYGDREGEVLESVVRGAIQPLPDGGILVTETEGGRAFQIDRARNIVWEYINRYDAESVIEMTTAEAYPRAYFTVTDWSCP